MFASTQRSLAEKNFLQKRPVSSSHSHPSIIDLPIYTQQLDEDRSLTLSSLESSVERCKSTAIAATRWCVFARNSPPSPSAGRFDPATPCFPPTLLGRRRPFSRRSGVIISNGYVSVVLPNKSHTQANIAASIRGLISCISKVNNGRCRIWDEYFLSSMWENSHPYRFRLWKLSKASTHFGPFPQL